MPKFVSAQYVPNEAPAPGQPPMLIRAVDEDGVVWWLDDNCTQGDWLEFVAKGGTVKEVEAKEPDNG